MRENSRNTSYLITIRDDKYSFTEAGSVGVNLSKSSSILPSQSAGGKDDMA
jgi:hypothetical protein